jgi:pilus assembly protein Flp/PilA
MKRWQQSIKRFLNDEEGANAVEYSLLAGLIAVAFIVGATALGTALNTFFTNLAGCITNPGACNPFPGGGGGGAP